MNNQLTAMNKDQRVKFKRQMDQTIKNMQVRMPRRQQILSQTLMPIAKNRITTLRQSNESDYDELRVDETPYKSELVS